MLKEFLENIVKPIVDKPDEVRVTVNEGETVCVYELRVGAGDYGKIIGRKGRIIHSIRTLLAVCARDSGKKWVLDVPDKESRDS